MVCFGFIFKFIFFYLFCWFFFLLFILLIYHIIWDRLCVLLLWFFLRLFMCVVLETLLTNLKFSSHTFKMIRKSAVYHICQTWVDWTLGAHFTLFVDSCSHSESSISHRCVDTSLFEVPWWLPSSKLCSPVGKDIHFVKWEIFRIFALKIISACWVVSSVATIH